MASLGKDLAIIRKEKNVSLDDIREATRIPMHILNAIEDGSIFTSYEENPTYIRSYVRSYAKALAIDEKDIIYALDKQEKGSYSGSLRETEDLPERSFGEEEEKDNEPQEENQADATTPEQAPEPVSKQQRSVSSSQQFTPSQQPDVESVDWADLGRRFQPLQSTKSKVWLSAIITVLVVASAIFIYYYQSDSSTTAQNQANTPQQSSSISTSTDSLQLDLAPAAANDSINLAENTADTIQSRNLETLPDTLSLVVYAAYGKLEPVRVYTDIMANINPYWIEQGDALKFNFVNEVRIRGSYNRMVLLMNGHVIQNFRERFFNPETRLLEIHRSFFKGDPKWLKPAPDSLGIDAPPPSAIKKRPTFN